MKNLHKNQAKSTKILDIFIRMGYDDGTTISTSGYPHPSFCGFFTPCVCACQANTSPSSYDGSREPNTTPLAGNKLRRLVAVVAARRPMPTKQSAISTPTNLRETTMSHTITIADFTIGTLNNLYSLNDLHKASGGLPKHQPANFMRNAETQALILAIENEHLHRSSNLMNGKNDNLSRCSNLSNGKLVSYLTVQGGNNKTEQGTYVCKELVYRYAMWVSPKFSLTVIRAFDEITNGDYIPCTQTQPTSPILSPADYAVIKQAVYNISSGMRFSNTNTNAIYARLRTLCGVDSVCELRYEHLPLIQNELYRIERILAPYKKMRSETEKQLIRRICGEDELAISQAILDIEKTATAYAKAGDRCLSATLQIERIGQIGGKR